MTDLNNKLNRFFENRCDTLKMFTFPAEDCVQLCWADPYYPVSQLPAEIRQACLNALDNVGAHYTSPAGLAALRKAYAKKIKNDSGMDVDPDNEIIIAPGADSGLFYSMLPFIEPGSSDEVLILSPSYTNNGTNAGLMGVKPVYVPLDESKGYRIDFDALENAVTENTRMIAITNPNNPTGRCYSEAELHQMADFVISHNLIAVVDQAFEDTVFSGNKMISLASLSGMRERTVTIRSMSKGFGLCGFRIGCITVPEAYCSSMQSLAVNVLGAPNTIAQYGALAALQIPEIAERNRAFFEKRTKRAYEMLTSISGINCIMPQAGFFLWPDVSSIGSALEVVQYCAEKAGVFFNPGNPFGHTGNDHIRIITASLTDDKAFYAAIERICKVLPLLADQKKGVKINK